MNKLHDPNCINILLAAGFRYDEEDNLWYDENQKREKYFYRIGIGNNGRYFDLFDGHSKNIGRYFSINECMLHVV